MNVLGNMLPKIDRKLWPLNLDPCYCDRGERGINCFFIIRVCVDFCIVALA